MSEFLKHQIPHLAHQLRLDVFAIEQLLSRLRVENFLKLIPGF